jgi:hypothetical protein
LVFIDAVFFTDMLIQRIDRMCGGGKLGSNVLINPLLPIYPSMASVFKMGVIEIMKISISDLRGGKSVHPFHWTSVELQVETADRRQGTPETISRDPDLIASEIFEGIANFIFDYAKGSPKALR